MGLAYYGRRMVSVLRRKYSKNINHKLFINNESLKTYANLPIEALISTDTSKLDGKQYDRNTVFLVLIRLRWVLFYVLSFTSFKQFGKYACFSIPPVILKPVMVLHISINLVQINKLARQNHRVSKTIFVM